MKFSMINQYMYSAERLVSGVDRIKTDGEIWKPLIYTLIPFSFLGYPVLAGMFEIASYLSSFFIVIRNSALMPGSSRQGNALLASVGCICVVAKYT